MQGGEERDSVQDTSVAALASPPVTAAPHDVGDGAAAPLVPPHEGAPADGLYARAGAPAVNPAAVPPAGGAAGGAHAAGGGGGGGDAGATSVPAPQLPTVVADEAGSGGASAAAPPVVLDPAVAPANFAPPFGGASPPPAAGSVGMGLPSGQTGASGLQTSAAAAANNSYTMLQGNWRPTAPAPTGIGSWPMYPGAPLGGTGAPGNQGMAYGSAPSVAPQVGSAPAKDPPADPPKRKRRGRPRKDGSDGPPAKKRTPKALAECAHCHNMVDYLRRNLCPPCYEWPRHHDGQMRPPEKWMKKCKICQRHVRKARKGVCLQCETERDANKNARSNQSAAMPQAPAVAGMIPAQDGMIDPAMMMVPGNYMQPYFTGTMGAGMTPAGGMTGGMTGNTMPLWMLGSGQTRLPFPMDGNLMGGFDGSSNISLGNGSGMVAGGHPSQGTGGAGSSTAANGSGTGSPAVPPSMAQLPPGANFNFPDPSSSFFQQDFPFATPPPSGTAPLSTNPVLPSVNSSGSQSTSLPSYSSPSGAPAASSKDEDGAAGGE